MKTTGDTVRKTLLVIIGACAAITLIGSVLFTVFSDFLSQFPTDSF